MRNIGVASAWFWILCLGIGTLIWSGVVLSQLGGAEEASQKALLGEAIGFSAIPFGIGAVVGIIAYGISRNLAIALFSWTGALFIAVAIVSFGAVHHLRHPVALNDAVPLLPVDAAIAPCPATSLAAWRNCADRAWTRIEKVVLLEAQAEGTCRQVKEALDSFIRKFESGLDPADSRIEFVKSRMADTISACTNQLAPTSTPTGFSLLKSMIWGDRTRDASEPSNNHSMYENCLRRLVKDARTSEAARIGESFCRERYRPGFLDKFFR